MSRVTDLGAIGAIRTEGGILPADLLQRVAAGDRAVPGLDEGDYHLGRGDRIADEIARAWNRLRGAWAAFGDERGRRPAGDAATGLTRDRWLLPLFQELGYGRLTRARAGEFDVDGRGFAISHAWHRSPIHLVGWGVDLDVRQPGVAGAAAASPHGLVQELLNRSSGHLWGFVANGALLRILRDHRSLTRQAYVEFDLQRIFDDQLFHAFRLLWLVAHQSRVEAEDPAACWLERWFQLSREEGVSVLEKMREGVEQAIAALGRGFLRHPRNQALKQALAAPGGLDRQDFYRQLLRLVYRLIFLFVAEDRGVLLDPAAPAEARDRYQRFYALRRLRTLARRRRGGPHGDLWHGLRLVMDALDEGCPSLGLPGLGSFLWRRDALGLLGASELANEDLLDAIRRLSTFVDRNHTWAVNWRNVGSEELGSIYESLLELSPELNKDAGTFDLKVKPGHERKTTGSYYTPTSLVDCLLDSALDPALDEAARAADPVAALLGLKVCDPACGSGHFLVAAARRIARRVALARSGGAEPSPIETQQAMRDVVQRCLYGVDVTEMAVELCKVSLWLEAVRPGQPLPFLEGHIQHGNALLGTTPALLAGGIPDDAWEPITGDEKEVARRLKKRNKQERGGQETLFAGFAGAAARAGAEVVTEAREIDARREDDRAALGRKEQDWTALVGSQKYLRERFVADAWCTAFVWRKTAALEDAAPTHGAWLALREGRREPGAALIKEVEAARRQYRWLHWHLAFPTVFDAEGQGGFAVVLGNPPWEHVELKEVEWFAARRPDIANAANADARKKAIARLEREDPPLYDAYLEDLREFQATNQVVRESGRYPLSARGRINTYALFAELNRTLMGPSGRVGCIVPGGIATDDTTKELFASLVKSRELVSLYHFENEEKVFADVHNAFRFCLLTLARRRAEGAAEFAFFARQVTALLNPDRRFSLVNEDFALLNPNTRTCPTFRWRRDAELNKEIYRRVPVLLRDDVPDGNPWGLRFLQGLFNMASDSGLFRMRAQLEADGGRLRGNVFEHDDARYLPLYEAKMIHQFDHRFGTYRGQTQAQANKGFLPQLSDEDHADPSYLPLSNYWVDEESVEARLSERWSREWLLGWRDITGTEKMRTTIAAVVPRVACGDTFLLMLPDDSHLSRTPMVYANLCSFVFDYSARQKVGGTHLKYHTFKQLPILPPSAYDAPSPWHRDLPLHAWILPRVLELTYTAWDLAAFARDCGYDGPPFRWDPARRLHLRAELDAAYFHLYGIARADVDYILETFPIVKDKDLKRFDGEYRTKTTILDCFDRMAAATASGQPYQTSVDPPPADPRVAHPPADEDKGGKLLPFRPKPAASPVPPALVPAADIGNAPPTIELPAATASRPARPIVWPTRRGVWSHPEAELSQDDLAFRALLAVLDTGPEPAPKEQVRLALVIVREPVLATRLLTEDQRKKWLRAVGTQAEPQTDNLARLVPREDPAAAEAILLLEKHRAIVSGPERDTWISTPKRESCDDSDAWLLGRATVAWHIVQRLGVQRVVEEYEQIRREGTSGSSA